MDRPAQRIASIALIAAVYFAAAKFSLWFAIPAGYATAVWPPSGIAVAALLRFCTHLGWGVSIRAVLANFSVQESLPTSLSLATGNAGGPDRGSAPAPARAAAAAPAGRDRRVQLRHIGRDPALCNIPVVALTGSKLDQDTNRAYQLGVISHVTKPPGIRQYAMEMKIIESLVSV